MVDAGLLVVVIGVRGLVEVIEVVHVDAVQDGTVVANRLFDVVSIIMGDHAHALEEIGILRVRHAGLQRGGIGEGITGLEELRSEVLTGRGIVLVLELVIGVEQLLHGRHGLVDGARPLRKRAGGYHRIAANSEIRVTGTIEPCPENSEPAGEL